MKAITRFLAALLLALPLAAASTGTAHAAAPGPARVLGVKEVLKIESAKAEKHCKKENEKGNPCIPKHADEKCPKYYKKTDIGLIAYKVCLVTDAKYANFKAATAHCLKLEKKGEECRVTSKKNCGKGWKTSQAYGGKKLKKFRACKLSTSALNKRKAEDECARLEKKNKHCKVVRKKTRCGKGWKKGKSFGKKVGTRYKVCTAK